MVHRYGMDLKAPISETSIHRIRYRRRTISDHLDPISVQGKECGGGRPGRFRTKWTKSILRGSGWSSLWPVWGRPGRPNAAVFFKEPVENLVSDSALEAISSGSEYLMQHYVASDISCREAAAPAGARYLRKPDEGKAHGAVGPRTFVIHPISDDPNGPVAQPISVGPLVHMTWTIANVSAIGAIGSGPEYQVVHNGPPDISRRESDIGPDAT